MTEGDGGERQRRRQQCWWRRCRYDEIAHEHFFAIFPYFFSLFIYLFFFFLLLTCVPTTSSATLSLVNTYRYTYIHTITVIDAYVHEIDFYYECYEVSMKNVYICLHLYV